MHSSGVDFMNDIPTPAGSATFVILADGDLGDLIARLADDQAAFDRSRRRIVHVPLAPGSVGTGNAAALILDAQGMIWGYLDEVQATTAAWIENAFLRAGNSPSTTTSGAPALRASIARGSGLV